MSVTPSYLESSATQINFYTDDLRQKRVQNGKIVELQLFRNVEFQREINLSGVIFENGVSFRRCIFLEKVDFSGTRFCGSSEFWRCTFKKQADFSNAVFAKLDKGIRSDTDNGRADFSWSRFENEADFLWTQFEGPVFFWRTIFEKFAKLEATFRSDVIFEGDVRLIRIARRDCSNLSLFEKLAEAGLLSQDNEDPCCAAMSPVETRFLEKKLRAVHVSDDNIQLLKSDLARLQANMFSAEGASFCGAKFARPTDVKFRNLDVRNCHFLDSNTGRAIFQNVIWDRQPTFLGATSRRAVCDERPVPAKNKLPIQTLRALGTLYNDLRVNHEEKALFEDAMDFQYGEMETRRRSQPILVRCISLTAWYRYLSAYGTRPGLALFWLLIGVFLVFPLLYLWTGNNHHIVDAVIHSLETSAFMEAARNGGGTIPIATRFISGFERLLIVFQAGLFVLAIQRKFGRK
jgi:uncharacterized protein YjbI with pentapeptide repeats